MEKIHYFTRYEQHIELPGVGLEGQKKLYAAKVLVVGCGGLGNPVLQYLVAAGIGTIGIIDGDIVSESNLQRQILFTNADVGKLKVDMAKEKLDKLSHGQTIIPYPFFLDGDNAPDIIQEYDIVVDATDNHVVRLLLNKLCLRFNKPWVYGALYHFEGHVMRFNANAGGPCFQCVFPDLKEDDNLPTCKSAGVLASLPGVIGSLQATEVLGIILALYKTETKDTLHIVNTLSYEIQRVTVPCNPECPECAPHHENEYAIKTHSS